MRSNAIIALAAAITLAGATGASYAQSMSDGNDPEVCDSYGIANQIGMEQYDPKIAATAPNANIVQVPGCASGDVSSALASKQAAEARKDIQSNPGALQQIHALGRSVADVLGATTSGDTVTVYLRIS